METNLANFQHGCREALELLDGCRGYSSQHPWGLMSVLKTTAVTHEEKKLNARISDIFDVSEGEDKAEEGRG